MNFLFRERVDAGANPVFAAFSDAAFYDTLELPHVGTPEVIEISREAMVTRARVRYRYRGDLPPGAARFVTPERLSWVEVSTHRTADRLIEMKLVADYYGDRFDGRATHRVIPIEPDEDRDQPERCWWETAGSISIRLPFMARQVERAIVGGLGEDLRMMVGPLGRYSSA